MDCFKFSSHRMLSFFSMGTRVGLIFLLSAAVPFELVLESQNFTAHNPSGNPAVVIAKARMHQDSTGRVHSGIASQISFAVGNALP